MFLLRDKAADEARHEAYEAAVESAVKNGGPWPDPITPTPAEEAIAEQAKLSDAAGMAQLHRREYTGLMSMRYYPLGGTRAHEKAEDDASVHQAPGYQDHDLPTPTASGFRLK